MLSSFPPPPPAMSVADRAFALALRGSASSLSSLFSSCGTFASFIADLLSSSTSPPPPPSSSSSSGVTPSPPGSLKRPRPSSPSSSPPCPSCPPALLRLSLLPPYAQRLLLSLVASEVVGKGSVLTSAAAPRTCSNYGPAILRIAMEYLELHAGLDLQIDGSVKQLLFITAAELLKSCAPDDTLYPSALQVVQHPLLQSCFPWFRRARPFPSFLRDSPPSPSSLPPPDPGRALVNDDDRTSNNVDVEEDDELYFKTDAGELRSSSGRLLLPKASSSQSELPLQSSQILPPLPSSSSSSSSSPPVLSSSLQSKVVEHAQSLLDLGPSPTSSDCEALASSLCASLHSAASTHGSTGVSLLLSSLLSLLKPPYLPDHLLSSLTSRYATPDLSPSLLKAYLSSALLPTAKALSKPASRALLQAVEEVCRRLAEAGDAGAAAEALLLPLLEVGASCDADNTPSPSAAAYECVVRLLGGLGSSATSVSQALLLLLLPRLNAALANDDERGSGDSGRLANLRGAFEDGRLLPVLVAILSKTDLSAAPPSTSGDFVEHVVAAASAAATAPPDGPPPAPPLPVSVSVSVSAALSSSRQPPPPPLPRQSPLQRLLPLLHVLASKQGGAIKRAGGAKEAMVKAVEGGGGGSSNAFTVKQIVNCLKKL